MEIFGLSIKTKVSGVWKSPLIKVKVSGSWVFVKQVWTKISGTWKRTWVSNIGFLYGYSSSLDMDIWQCRFVGSGNPSTNGVPEFQSGFSQDGVPSTASNLFLDDARFLQLTIFKDRSPTNVNYPNGLIDVEFRISSARKGSFDNNTQNNYIRDLENSGQFVKSITFGGITLRRTDNSSSGSKFSYAGDILNSDSSLRQFYWSWRVAAPHWNPKIELGTTDGVISSGFAPLSVELGYN